MIEGGWPFVAGAYALALGALLVLTCVVALRAWHWAKQARELDAGKR